MVVVVDATGSMTLTRTDGVQRFEAARQLAADRVFNAAMEAGGLSAVAVYTFDSFDGVQQWSTGGSGPAGAFVTPTQARSIILNNIAVSPFATPLADALCSTVDIANASGSASTTVRFLEFYTDGGENDSTGPCSGPFSVSTSPPYDATSWQGLVYQHFVNITPAVTTNATLFTDVSGFAAFARPAAATNDAPSRPTPKVGAFALADLVSDQDFFASLSVATGGDFTEVSDGAPVPVFGDVDGDFDVDRNDAIALARDFGGPATRTFDLNDDGKVGFADYAILLTKFGTGSGTPAPDPYTTSGPISCSSGDVVIDGQAIENLDITVSADKPCSVTIRNSLIVSGSFALTTHGSVNVTVDNSILVGETGWLSGNGAVKLSAANSVFHGAAQGKFKLTDRGGNVFE
jgi:hypothetical protein